MNDVLVFGAVVPHIETLEHFFVALNMPLAGDLGQAKWFGKFWRIVADSMSVASGLQLLVQEVDTIKDAIERYKSAVGTQGKDANFTKPSDTTSPKSSGSSSSQKPPAVKEEPNDSGDDGEGSDKDGDGDRDSNVSSRGRKRYRHRSLNDLFNFSLSFEDQVPCYANGSIALCVCWFVRCALVVGSKCSCFLTSNVGYG